MGDGFGAGVLFQIDDDANSNRPIAQISAIRANNEDTSGSIQFGVYSGGNLNPNAMTIAYNNAITMEGTLTVTGITYADQINERTSGSGVTIDSALIKEILLTELLR